MKDRGCDASSALDGRVQSSAHRVLSSVLMLHLNRAVYPKRAMCRARITAFLEIKVAATKTIP